MKFRTFNDTLGDSYGPTMVELPSGIFIMGDDNSPHDDEKPAHEVYVESFAMADAPITFSQYDFFCRSTDRPLIDSKGMRRGSCPVINVSFYDALEYCRWLSEITGGEYYLPTEEEWEYACRAGTTTQFSFGDQEADADQYAWTHNNSNRQTQPVRTKLPNPWGLYDMHGNVWEWCDSDYTENYKHKIKQ